MINQLAQLLILFSSAAIEPEASEVKGKVDTESPYRTRCHQCDELGRDARLPCEGHA